MSDRLTEQQLTDIETRANAATAGPWCTDSWEIYQGTEYQPGAEWIGETCRAGEMDDSRADAEFVAAAREDVPALLAEVRRLRAELDEAAEDVSWLRCLEAAGVDNWDGYDEAIQAAESASS
jgi:hypothetical protein